MPHPAPAILAAGRERLGPAPAGPPPPQPAVLPPVARETRVERLTVVHEAAAEPRPGAVLRPRPPAPPEARRVEVLRPAPAPRDAPPAPRSPPRVEREHGPDGAAPQPAAAPVIHVTIGRLEVRAAAQPHVPPRPAREQPPVMELDDYLRQRASGSRP